MDKSIRQSFQLEFHKERARESNEWATDSLVHYVFNKAIFPDKKWNVVGQHPPTSYPEDRRRVDTKVELVNDNLQCITVLIGESKQHAASPSQIETCKMQAYIASRANLESSKQSALWVSISIGTRWKLYIFRLSDDYLTNYYPETEDDFASLDTDEITDFIEKFAEIRDHPIPPESFFKGRRPLPRPTDDEFGELDEEWREPFTGPPLNLLLQPVDMPPAPAD
ncbi:hypothetical protein F5Y02DRAFT_420547 [Annulohypoxylon stygium]|nr:hypothetical protein F5Y02DRAFT_420547 [Annulohypoxylon stygium]